MKLLRETIQNILLENAVHYEKIAALLCTGDITSVKQGLELAEAMGYAHRIEYEYFERSSDYDPRKVRKVHRWTFSVPREFEAMISNKYGKTNKVHDFAIYPIRSHSIGIKIVE